MSDPIRALIDARIDDLDWGDSFAPLADALRAVLNLCAEALPMPCGSPTQALTPDRVLRVIAEHLGVTDG